MATETPVVFMKADRVRLGAKIGEGGEGIVYGLEGDPQTVAKIYKQAVPDKKTAKLRLLVTSANQELTKIAAWPTNLLTSEKGHVVGFTMPSARGYMPIHRLYSPIQRPIDFPGVDWANLIHVARNLAAAFDVIHKHHHVVGDVNQCNVTVSPTGTIKLIDCDSFQIRDGQSIYRCEVGVGHFTPPELQSQSFDSVERTEDHDCFGLAVLIFHLMFAGRHPFAGIVPGKGDFPIEKAIAARRFVFSQNRIASDYLPPPHTIRLKDLSPQIAELFETAFLSEKPVRPTAATWLSTLDTFKSELTTCTSLKGHRYYSKLPECSWCALIKKGAPDFFITLHIGSVRDIVFDIVALWNSILNIPAPERDVPPPIRPTARHRNVVPDCPPATKYGTPWVLRGPFVRKPWPQAMKKPLVLESIGIGGLSGTVILLCCNWFTATGAAGLWGAGLLTLFGGNWWLGRHLCAGERKLKKGEVDAASKMVADFKPRLEPLVNALETCQTRLATAHQVWVSATEELNSTESALADRIYALRMDKWSTWSKHCANRNAQFGRIKDGLQRHRKRYDQYQEEEQKELKRLEDGRQAQQRKAHLQRHAIGDAYIPGIGGGLKKALADANIVCAADVFERRIARIPYFKEARIEAMLNWRAEVENSFLFDPTKGIDPVAMATVRMKYNRDRGNIVTRLQAGCSEMEALVAEGRQQSAEIQRDLELVGSLETELQKDRLEQLKTKTAATEQVFQIIASERNTLLTEMDKILQEYAPVRERACIAMADLGSVAPMVARPFRGRPRKNSDAACQPKVGEPAREQPVEQTATATTTGSVTQAKTPTTQPTATKGTWMKALRSVFDVTIGLLSLSLVLVWFVLLWSSVVLAYLLSVPCHIFLWLLGIVSFILTSIDTRKEDGRFRTGYKGNAPAPEGTAGGCFGYSVTLWALTEAYRQTIAEYQKEFWKEAGKDEGAGK